MTIALQPLFDKATTGFPKNEYKWYRWDLVPVIFLYCQDISEKMMSGVRHNLTPKDHLFVSWVQSLL